MQVNPLATKQGPDLPDVVIHLTGRRGPVVSGGREAIQGWTEDQRLGSILLGRHLISSMPFGTSWHVVSMTEATRAGLAHLVRQRYAPVGIAFHKQAVFTAGGGPVFYVRGDEFDAFQTSNLSGAMKSRAVRYWPGARPTRAEPFVTLLTSATESLSEWRHEREWRIPSPAGGEWSWSFEPQDVAFLLHPQGRKGVETAVGGFKDHDGPEHDWVKGRPVLRFDWSAGKFEDDDEVHWP